MLDASLSGGGCSRGKLGPSRTYRVQRLIDVAATVAPIAPTRLVCRIDNSPCRCAMVSSSLLEPGFMLGPFSYLSR